MQLSAPRGQEWNHVTLIPSGERLSSPRVVPAPGCLTRQPPGSARASSGRFLSCMDRGVRGHLIEEGGSFNDSVPLIPVADEGLDLGVSNNTWAAFRSQPVDVHDV